MPESLSLLASYGVDDIEKVVASNEGDSPVLVRCSPLQKVRKVMGCHKRISKVFDVSTEASCSAVDLKRGQSMSTVIRNESIDRSYHNALQRVVNRTLDIFRRITLHDLAIGTGGKALVLVSSPSRKLDRNQECEVSPNLVRTWPGELGCEGTQLLARGIRESNGINILLGGGSRVLWTERHVICNVDHLLFLEMWLVYTGSSIQTQGWANLALPSRIPEVRIGCPGVGVLLGIVRRYRFLFGRPRN